MRGSSALPLVLALAGSSLLLGCPNPNLYGTPRTVPQGQIQHTIALEGIYVGGTVTNSNSSGTGTTKESVGIGLPMFPTYMLRYGISDEFDFGFRVANLSSLGLDVKWNFLKSTDIDLAIDPGLQWFGVFTGNGSINLFYFHVPAIVGFNFGKDVTLFASPGFVYALGVGSLNNSSNQNSVVTAGGVMARLGVGIQFRTSKSFAITPEVGAMRAFNDVETLIIVGGIGLSFGKIPSYQTQRDPIEPAPPPAPGTAPPGTAPTPAPTPAPAPAQPQTMPPPSGQVQTF